MTYLLMIAAILAVLGYLIHRKPDTFSYTRSAVIHATPEAVFREVEDFRRWAFWSPWAPLDPNCKNSFEGSESGVGSVFNWDGNSKVGAGKMTITETRPHEVILLDLQFYKPMKALNHTEFTFTPQEDGTLVRWTMSGRTNFMGKLIDTVMNCEKMVGDMFVKGLVNLKKVVEAKA
ncbi:MAG: SRPBCC family protein [Alphaproteobacteria bacterium]|nr:SRPBCC family protein [Alphaproteobacteria bacterium]